MSEDQPVGVRIDVEEVADDHTQRQLDQRDGEADLDRDDAGYNDRCRQDRGGLHCIHEKDLHSRRR
ncbi:MAG TPA: hypothetical protein VFN72_12785 [Solirubrobacterales bacterium]|nr:hypothetical protein [Solirubrobacterales bacterium]